MKEIDKLIINVPYEKPLMHWSYDSSTKEFSIKNTQRLAGYTLATPGYKGTDDPGVFHSMELVNKIRPLVDEWRKNEWPGATGTSKKLLRYWSNRVGSEENKRFFFCQLEAIETLIWLCEVANSEARKIMDTIPGDGGGFMRLCCKMATGSGKTIVMGMINSWQILNKVRAPNDERFSKHILIISPGLTVKSRLQVLDPSSNDNYYDAFNLIPPAMKEIFTQGKVLVHNWHTLAWETSEKLSKKKSVDKRGAKSDNAYVRDILGGLYREKDWIVINDEAHHAWRHNLADANSGNKIATDESDAEYLKEDKKTATVWIEGLDRIHKASGIKYCFDMSATPFAPTGGKNYESILYNWIVSDFGLNDAIESGLVKSPRVTIKDNSKKSDAQHRSYLFHIYKAPGVKESIVNSGKELESEPLPGLVIQAYNLMASVWKENYLKSKKVNSPVPPVMITVANNVTTAARIKKAFIDGKIFEKELCKEERILQIDSKILKDTEQADKGYDLAEKAGRGGKRTQKEREEELRLRVSTIGVPNSPGAQFCNIISVAMLSEGWDARTVTNIIGLRAFSSQLLCEQVIGRGLRRASYEVGDDGLFKPEYVDVYGVPFSFLPYESEGVFTPVKPKVLIKPDDDKKEHEISWPNIIGINYKRHNLIKFDLKNIEPVKLDPEKNITKAKGVPIMEGKVMDGQAEEKDHGLEHSLADKRFSTYVFNTAQEVYKEFFKITKQLDVNVDGNAGDNDKKGTDLVYDMEIMAQIIKAVQEFVAAGKIQVMHRLPDNEWLECKSFENQNNKETLITDFSYDKKVVSRIASSLVKSDIKKRTIIYDPLRKSRSTSDMPHWYTGKPCNNGQKCHINLTVYDSRWEESSAYIYEEDKKVRSYVKNDGHVGFKIFYRYQGVVREYYPDYIVEIEDKDGNIEKLIVEVKGREWDGEDEKMDAVTEWVKAVNESNEWGTWRYEKFGDITKS